MSSLPLFLSALAQDAGPLGLIVVDDPSAIELPLPPEVECTTIGIREGMDVEAAIDQIANCADEGCWLRLNVAGSFFPPSLYDKLRSLAVNGHFQIVRGDRVEDVAWPRTAKIVVVTRHDSLEQIAIPTFLNLFGPVYREV